MARTNAKTGVRVRFRKNSTLTLVFSFDDLVEILRRVFEQDAEFGGDDRFSFVLS
ncbi:hypothetical protein D3C81_1044840 [compost metagenome]